MVNVSKEELRRFVKANSHRSETTILGENFKVFKNCQLHGEVVNVISFHGRNFAVEEVKCKKMRYIEMDEYLLSIPSHPEKENHLCFSEGFCYNMKDGSCTSMAGTINDYCYVGALVVIDRRILALGGKKNPRFFIVVAGQLREIPSFIVEQILRNKSLNSNQQSALKSFCGANWENHNGILINPETLEVPGSLQIYAWKRSNFSKVVLKQIDFTKLMYILTRNETKDVPAVKFVSSEHF